MARMRTIQQTIEHLKERDPDTAVSAWWLRTMVKNGKIKHHRAGSKYLIDLDALEEFFENPPENNGDLDNADYGKLRKIY